MMMLLHTPLGCCLGHRLCIQIRTHIDLCMFIYSLEFICPFFILLFIHLYQVLKWCIKKIFSRTDMPFRATLHTTHNTTELIWAICKHTFRFLCFLLPTTAMPFPFASFRFFYYFICQWLFFRILSKRWQNKQHLFCFFLLTDIPFFSVWVFFLDFFFSFGLLASDLDIIFEYLKNFKVIPTISLRLSSFNCLLRFEETARNHQNHSHFVLMTCPKNDIFPEVKWTGGPSERIQITLEIVDFDM